MSTPSRYATPADLASMALPAGALSGISATDQQAALDARSAFVDGYLKTRYTLPLLTWDESITRAVCDMAAWDLLKRRGFNPENPADSAIRMGFDDAMRWLREVANQEAHPTVTESSPVTFAPVVISGSPRGW